MELPKKKLKRLAKRICPDGNIEWDDFEKLGRNVLAMKRLFLNLQKRYDKLLFSINKK